MYEIIIGEIVACVVAMYGLYSLNKLFLSNKLLEADRKLRSTIANFKNEYKSFAGDSTEIVKGALGDVGIEGIMQELGIDPKILNNPLVKGLVDRYAPQILAQLNKGGKDGVSTETKSGFM